MSDLNYSKVLIKVRPVSQVRGCYLSVVERLDEEFMKVLKSCDAHSHEYVDRLKDEPRVVQVGQINLIHEALSDRFTFQQKSMAVNLISDQFKFCKTILLFVTLELQDKTLLL